MLHLDTPLSIQILDLVVDLMCWLVRDLSATWTRLCVYLVTLHLLPICFDKIYCVWCILYSDPCIYQQCLPAVATTTSCLEFEISSNLFPSPKQNIYKKKIFLTVFDEKPRFLISKILRFSFKFCMFIFYSAFVNNDASFQSLYNLVMKEVCRVIYHILLFVVVKIGYFNNITIFYKFYCFAIASVSYVNVSSTIMQSPLETRYVWVIFAIL